MGGCNCKGNCNTSAASCRLGRTEWVRISHNAYLMGTFHARPLKRVECFANDANRNELLLFIIASSSSSVHSHYVLLLHALHTQDWNQQHHGPYTFLLPSLLLFLLGCCRWVRRRENRLIAISTSIANIPIKKMQVNNSHCVWRWRPLLLLFVGIAASHSVVFVVVHIISEYGYKRVL